MQLRSEKGLHEVARPYASVIPQEKGSPHRRGKRSNHAPPAVLPCRIYFLPIFGQPSPTGEAGNRAPSGTREASNRAPPAVLPDRLFEAWPHFAAKHLQALNAICCRWQQETCCRWPQETGGCQSKGVFSGHTLTSVLKNHRRSKDKRVRYCICHFEASWDVPSQRDNMSASSLAAPGT